MFKRILVPLDGSERAERALPVAARLAHATSGALLLLRVISPSDLLAPSAASVVEAISTKHDRANAYLREVMHRPGLADIPIECQLWEGDAASAILDDAALRQIDVIVMSSHGQGGLLRWALGSVAEHVARHATMPVLVIRGDDGAVFSGPRLDAERPLRILVSLDGSALAEAAFAPATELVAALAAPNMGAVHLVRVVRRYTVEEQAEQHPGMAPAALPVVEEAKAYLSSVAAQARQTQRVPVQLTWSVNISGDVAQALLEVATHGEDAEVVGGAGRCDLIALATHGRTGLQRWAVGSVTERVLSSSRLPVLIVRPVGIVSTGSPGTGSQ